jgi:DMSO/TMAO reductase YedYZ molybdopterin-dependent catalytic subunit
MTRHLVNTQPYNAETALAELTAHETPRNAHYVRSNFATPQLAAAEYQLLIDGAVVNAQSVSFDALRALPAHDVFITMECAGNDRLGMQPLPDGEPWASGAVSSARWRGARLRDVLALVGVSSDVLEVLAEGADHGPREDALHQSDVRFARSMPLAAATDPDTLVAYEMNGAPIPAMHGAPVRLIVPGWYGMANVKWLHRVSLLTTPFTGYFQSQRYVYDAGGTNTPVTRMRVKSMITSPAPDRVISGAQLEVRGWAWSGFGAITQVEVAVGGGERWESAELETAASPHAWTAWVFRCPMPVAGRLVLRSRASDATGARQPDSAEWNRLGYGNNAVRAVTLTVAEA